MGTVGGGGIEKTLVDKSDVAFAAYEALPAGPIVGVNPLRALASSGKMLLGVAQGLRLLARHRPQAILLTGGWANVPLALAASLRNVPLLIYLPDIEPGSTIRVLKRFARRIAITVPAAAQHFDADKTIVTGYPLGTRITTATRAAGQRRFLLEPQRKTLLIFGGSRGARSINLAIEGILGALLADGLQIIHVTGQLDWARSQEATRAHHGDPYYRPQPYLDDMGLAFAAADLAICRSGASTLGEMPYFRLPSILVPYPYAWRYQKTNADYMTQAGAAVRVNDEAMHAQLLPTVRGLLGDDARYATMQAQLAAIAQPDSADKLAQALISVARA